MLTQCYEGKTSAKRGIWPQTKFNAKSKCILKKIKFMTQTWMCGSRWMEEDIWSTWELFNETSLFILCWSYSLITSSNFRNGHKYCSHVKSLKTVVIYQEEAWRVKSGHQYHFWPYGGSRSTNKTPSGQKCNYYTEWLWSIFPLDCLWVIWDRRKVKWIIRDYRGSWQLF